MAIIRTNGFVQLRRGLFAHVADGSMTYTEFFIYAAVLSNADPATGVWTGSAGTLSALFSVPARTCRDILEKLEKSGYVKRFMVHGRHTTYPIVVNRYECTDGAMRGKRLSADKSKEYDCLVYEECRDDAMTVPEPVPERVPEPVPVYREVENKKRSSRSKTESDPRHVPIRAKLGSYWEYAGLGKMPWDGSEAKTLDRLLKANPTLTVGDVGICLLNRHKSEGVNHAARPRHWLETLTDYRAGALDRYNKPKANGNGMVGIKFTPPEDWTCA